MTRREQMIECAEAMEQGMIHTQTTRDIWQNNLIWWICKAIKLLLEERINERPTEGWTRRKSMTSHGYLKTRSAEWLAEKLSIIMDCGCCPAADECAKTNMSGKAHAWECRRLLENWLNAERECDD